MTEEIFKRAEQIKQDIFVLRNQTMMETASPELSKSWRNWVEENIRKLNMEFENLDNVDKFIGFAYVRGIDFSYMGTAKKSGHRFCQEVRQEFDEYLKENDRENEIRSKNT